MRSNHLFVRAHATASAFAIPLALFLFVMSHSLAHAQNVSVGAVTISDAWSPPLPPVSANGVAYLKLGNHEMQADRLVSASTPVADRVEFHTSVKSGSMMMMEKMPAVELPPHGNVALAPGGMHLMLIKLKAPLKKDSRFPLTLTFERAGSVTIDVLVRAPAGASATPAMDHHKPHMHSK